MLGRQRDQEVQEQQLWRCYSRGDKHACETSLHMPDTRAQVHDLLNKSTVACVGGRAQAVPGSRESLEEVPVPTLLYRWVAATQHSTLIHLSTQICIKNFVPPSLESTESRERAPNEARRLQTMLTTSLPRWWELAHSPARRGPRPCTHLSQ
jgi:hypothetical protein